MTKEIRDLLVEADSLLSLVAHRYRVIPIPPDVVEDMKRVSLACRALAAPSPGSTAEPPRCPGCGNVPCLCRCHDTAEPGGERCIGPCCVMEVSPWDELCEDHNCHRQPEGSHMKSLCGSAPKEGSKP